MRQGVKDVVGNHLRSFEKMPRSSLAMLHIPLLLSCEAAQASPPKYTYKECLDWMKRRENHNALEALKGVLGSYVTCMLQISECSTDEQRRAVAAKAADLTAGFLQYGIKSSSVSFSQPFFCLLNFPLFP